LFALQQDRKAGPGCCSTIPLQRVFVDEANFMVSTGKEKPAVQS
jgi:hypothetical protein